jgi:hypothetical protein
LEPALVPTETLVPTQAVPSVTLGLAKTVEEVPDLGSMDNLIRVAEYFAAQPPLIAPDQMVEMLPGEYPDVSDIQISCNVGGLKNCAILAIGRVGDKYYLFMQFGTIKGPKNMLLSLESSHLGSDAKVAKIQLNRLNNGTDGFPLRIITRIKTSDYENTVIHKLAVGPNDPLPESSQLFGKGEISPELAITPMWVIVPW